MKRAFQIVGGYIGLLAALAIMIFLAVIEAPETKADYSSPTEELSK